MTLPLFNIGGLASGLDTNSIVSQLMELERIPIRQMEARRSTYQARNDAWTQITTRLDALREKVEALDLTSEWEAFSTATSSNESAVAVSVTGAPSSTKLTFTVDRLAAAHQVATNTAFSASTALVGAGTFSITIDGTQHDILTDATTTLSQLRDEIDRIDGVSSNLITVTPGQVKLFVTAGDSGSDSVFTTSATQSSLATFDTVQTGQDARITLGSGGGAVTIDRNTNVIDDLVDGVTLTLTDTTTAPVTVTVARDVDAAFEAVKTVVTEMNSTLSTIKTKTKTADADAGTPAGPLAGDSTARSLALSIRSRISRVVSGLSGSYSTASSVGISLTRTGDISLDETKLKKAIETDFDGVMELFARATSATDSRVSIGLASGAGLDGDHAVAITQAGTSASVTGSTYQSPTTAELFTITSGALVANVTIAQDATVDEAVAAITSALEAAGISTLTVSGGTGIVIEESRYGASNEFTVSANPFGLEGTYAGTDVAGTIDGIPAAGSGRSLAGTGDLEGLVLSVSATAAQVAAAGGTLDLGSVRITSGLAFTFDDYLESLVESSGAIDRAKDRWSSQIDLIDDRIERLEQRMDLRELSLRRQFSALETTMARLQSVSSQLSASLASLETGL